MLHHISAMPARMIPILDGSAEGAGFNSHGRKAVDCEPQDEYEARRADIYSLRINAAPPALNYSCFGSSTASRPWLFNDGPLDLVALAEFGPWTLDIL